MEGRERRVREIEKEIITIAVDVQYLILPLA